VTDLANNYQLYAQKRDEAQMADAMNEDRLLNIAVAQYPTFSMTPFRPKPLVNVVLGALTGMFLASFLAFFAEMGRSTIATPYEADRLLQYPLLATIPLELRRHDEQADLVSESSPISVVMGPGSTFSESIRQDLVRFRKEPRAS
jgi:capsular polysaccharide biosynthesis protein